MKTKTITSLDELVPGMKTKDGWEYLEATGRGAVICQHLPMGVLTIWAARASLEHAFLNQEVDVPEAIKD